MAASFFNSIGFFASTPDNSFDSASTSASSDFHSALTNFSDLSLSPVRNPVVEDLSFQDDDEDLLELDPSFDWSQSSGDYSEFTPANHSDLHVSPIRSFEINSSLIHPSDLSSHSDSFRSAMDDFEDEDNNFVRPPPHFPPYYFDMPPYFVPESQKMVEEQREEAVVLTLRYPPKPSFFACYGPIGTKPPAFCPPSKMAVSNYIVADTEHHPLLDDRLIEMRKLANNQPDWLNNHVDEFLESNIIEFSNWQSEEPMNMSITGRGNLYERIQPVQKSVWCFEVKEAD